MNEEIKAEWVGRLRSGRYTQGKSALNNVSNGTHCCLGVLCEIATEAGVVTKMTVEDALLTWDIIGRYVGASDESDGVLPEDVMIWAGLSEQNPLIPGMLGGDNKYGSSLAFLNDNEVDFNTIANLIEENL